MYTRQTRLAVAGEGETVRDAVDAVLRGADGPGAMAKALWAGLPQRCLAMAVLVTAQFLLFDSMRAVLAVSPKDLSVVLDVFQDRISYYEGWDEISQQWEEAISELGDLVS